MIWKYIRNLIFGNPEPEVIPPANSWPASTGRTSIADPWPRANTTPRQTNNTPRTTNNTPRPIINSPRPIQTRPALVKPRYVAVGSVQTVDEDDNDSSLLNTIVAAEVIGDLLTPAQATPVFQGYGGGDSGGAGATVSYQDNTQVDNTPTVVETCDAPVEQSYDSTPSCDPSPSCDSSPCDPSPSSD